MIAITFRRRCLALLLPVLLLLLFFVGSAVAAPAQDKAQSFASPKQAVDGLVAAVRQGSRDDIARILGPGSNEIVSSGDAVVDKESQERFVTLFDQKHRIDRSGSKAVLVLGEQEYPFPIPVVQRGKAWVFDTKAGKEEILNRRIGRNELAVIDVLHAYVDAQHEYAARKKGVAGFAQKIRSTPGKHDGLYWEAKEGEEESPFGPLAAKAASEGYTRPETEAPSPYHGYLFKILKGQGNHAQGGAFDYVVNGRMIMGFAMVAYPAQYGSSGIMTFIVNQNGVVYQKNLGPKTSGIASAMKLYDPDTSWKKVQ